MTNLIKINFESEDHPTVSGRELHDALEVKTAYKDWFPRMCEYGFEENRDFNPLKIEQVQTEGNRQVARQVIDHILTLDMAKEICMIQRTAKGKEFRKYFIEVEKNWNDPVMVLGRAYKVLERKNNELQEKNLEFENTIAVQSQQLVEMKPKASYYDVVLNAKNLLSTTKIAKDYGKSAVWLNNYLHEKKVQYKQGDIWLLYQKYAQQGYTSTKTSIYNGSDGTEHAKVHTYWTQKGRLFIYDLLKSDGLLPLIEKEK